MPISLDSEPTNIIWYKRLQNKSEFVVLTTDCTKRFSLQFCNVSRRITLQRIRRHIRYSCAIIWFIKLFQRTSRILFWNTTYSIVVNRNQKKKKFQFAVYREHLKHFATQIIALIQLKLLQPSILTMEIQKERFVKPQGKTLNIKLHLQNALG